MTRSWLWEWRDFTSLGLSTVIDLRRWSADSFQQPWRWGKRVPECFTHEFSRYISASELLTWNTLSSLPSFLYLYLSDSYYYRRHSLASFIFFHKIFEAGISCINLLKRYCAPISKFRAGGDFPSILFTMLHHHHHHHHQTSRNYGSTFCHNRVPKLWTRRNLSSFHQTEFQTRHESTAKLLLIESHLCLRHSQVFRAYGRFILRSCAARYRSRNGQLESNFDRGRLKSRFWFSRTGHSQKLIHLRLHRNFPFTKANLLRVTKTPHTIYFLLRYHFLASYVIKKWFVSACFGL